MTSTTTLSNTLGLDAATDRLWDAVVVGAGPAGALAARQLATAGVRVLLVDKKVFPRPKVCGACLNGQALSVLRSVGLGSLASQLGAITPEFLQIGVRGRSARFPLPEGLVLSRSRLDTALVEAAVAAGADLLQETQAAVEPAQGATRSTRLTHLGVTTPIHAKLVLVAAGIGNTCLDRAERVRTRIADSARIGAGTVLDEFPAAYREPAIFMAVGRAGYVGLVRTEDGRLNVAAALDKGIIKRCGGPGEAASLILSEAGCIPIPALASTPWQGTPGLTRRTRPIAEHRLFLLGDATGYVEPFTGEGMAWALASGQAIAPLALQGIDDWHPALERAWSRLHGRLVARRQTVCRGMATVLRHPWLSRVVFATATRIPATARILMQRVNSPPVPLETS